MLGRKRKRGAGLPEHPDDHAKRIEKNVRLRSFAKIIMGFGLIITLIALKLMGILFAASTGMIVLLGIAGLLFWNLYFVFGGEMRDLEDEGNQVIQTRDSEDP